MTNLNWEIATLISPAKKIHRYRVYINPVATFVSSVKRKVSRQITYMLDRPDVLARYSTRISPIAQYPILLSNGNRVLSR